MAGSLYDTGPDFARPSARSRKMEHLIYDADRDGAGEWELVSDQVMGGVSDGALSVQQVAGRAAIRLTGTVSTDNDGGFLQLARDVDSAAGWNGIALTVRGNAEPYNLHLRTTALQRPWQSFRATFDATEDWQTHRIAFDKLTAHRTDETFDAAALSRMGLVAIGRDFRADLALSKLVLFRD
ncbi:Complex I intermediate-associated protein 30 (CIA30) [Rhodobacteraceae bacterium THAF1]|uniref:CIA30 family protein n=1 Tax=Palleronia sp. THAF1 TaxID=2587842 RepID=UPI000F3F29BD|nr:CIA30 family protein [Palleronia sp. THAF1]QFU07690.1 Complex I intermediate-associated protein 30 (CIA30) [Palleronia sp. THAF1]VDC23146.1 Complex I intermediate-associated protein 30 (CIA30) [Rhodobacteraceae bacterium THAF1]